MKLAVLGTGIVGNTIGSKLIDLGHSVKMGSRSSNHEKALAFVAKHAERASEGTFAEAAAFGEVIFNCTAGITSMEALKSAGEENLRDKILIDVSNPLDPSGGFPPSLAVCNTDSLGEQIQAGFPHTKVVKTLNTMWCGLMVNPALIEEGDHQVFMSGNDDEAKVQVRYLLQTFGWPEKSILDLGNISTARGPEMWLPLWLRIFGVKKTGAFNLKIVSG